jgi:hypothetical protein
VSAALVLDSMLDGCQNETEFAEWLITEKKHYGPVWENPTDLESAWLYATQMWKDFHGSSERSH